MKHLPLIVLRVLLAVSPVLLALTSTAPAWIRDRAWYWPVVVGVSLVCVFAGFSTASAETPTAWLFHGLRSLHPRGAASTHRAERLVAKAKRSIKILDTYWGAANQFRSAIQDALRSSPASVRILLATQGGCLARIRDSAMPGEVAVDANLGTCIQNIDGLRKQLDQIDAQFSQRIEVRRYDAVVMGPLIIVDDTHVIAGTYLQSAGSPMTPSFEFRKRRFGSSEVVKHFVTTFDRIWTHSSS